MTEIQRRAVINTAKLVITCLLCGILIPLLFFIVPLEYIGIGAMVTMLGFFIKFAYDIEVDRLNRLEKLNG